MDRLKASSPQWPAESLGGALLITILGLTFFQAFAAVLLPFGGSYYGAALVLGIGITIAAGVLWINWLESADSSRVESE